MHRSIRKKVLWAAGATLIILGGASWLVYRSASQTSETPDGIDHAHQIMAAIDIGNLLALLVVASAVVGIRRDFVVWERSEAAADERRRGTERDAAERSARLDAADCTMKAHVETHEKIQEHCRQLERLSAVGRLTSGVAHDFNNLLTVMMGCCEATLYGLRPDDPSREPLGAALKAGETAVGLTRQLISWSHKRPTQLAPLDLNAVITETSRMLRRLTSGIELELSLDPSVTPVMADRVRIEQVLLNLIVNARDASAPGGRVCVETHRSGNEVQLAVIDKGCGMDEATKAQLFEPFFTTKEEGRGTGLGMAVVWEAVRESGGHIEVDSAPGRGTVISVYLPTTTESGVCPATVLVVDSEGRTIHFILDTLRQSGHTILQARHDEEALAVARAHAGPIHLLVTDTVPSPVSGADFALRLQAEQPAMKILYLVDGAATSVRLDPAATILPLPYSREVIGRTLREVLGR